MKNNLQLDYIFITALTCLDSSKSEDILNRNPVPEIIKFFVTLNIQILWFVLDTRKIDVLNNH